MSGLKNTTAGTFIGSLLNPATAIAGGAYGAGKDIKNATTLPTIPKAATMPTIDDVAVQAAKRRSLLEQISRRGRASTILTTDKLGG